MTRNAVGEGSDEPEADTGPSSADGTGSTEEDSVSPRRVVRLAALGVAVVSLFLIFGHRRSDLSVAGLLGVGGAEPYLLCLMLAAVGVVWLTGSGSSRLTMAAGGVAVAGGVVGGLGFADLWITRTVADAVGTSSQQLASRGVLVAFAGAVWPAAERTLRSWYDEATDEATPSPFENANVLKAVVSLLVALVPWLLVSWLYSTYGPELFLSAAEFWLPPSLILLCLFALTGVGLLAASRFYGRSAYSD